METYMPTCRIIANAENLSKVIAPLRSRCLQVRVPAPSEKLIADMLKTIARKENFELPPALAMGIAHNSRRNMRRAIMMLQTAKLKTPNLTNSTAVPRPDYEGFVANISREVVTEQSPAKLRAIRAMLYELLTKGITADLIF
jgi:replication factor C subunit 3/5